MAFDIARLEAQLNLSHWCNRQRESITDQLEAAFPDLLIAIEKRVHTMSALQFSRAALNPKPVAEELIRGWADRQIPTVLDRAEASLADVMASMRTDARYAEHLRAALPAVAGAGMMAASILGLPSVVSFATVTATSLFFFTTSAISVPLLLAGGTVLAGISIAGVKSLDKGRDKMRALLIRRLEAMAMIAIFGHGQPAAARCLLTDLQAAVIKAAEGTLLEAR